ncbi:unnamed protein product [Toxocara canis]|uniref:TFIID_20kDa domain-containing protein n=1 Tax=Toxocara canis TaxID=6265 RepID=A0A183UBM8_TOXCA|nr:unnamed protein product [Toxocara canis]
MTQQQIKKIRLHIYQGLNENTFCEQILNIALDVNVHEFDDLSTDKQTALLLTHMPKTVAVTDVSRITKVFLNDVKQRIGEQAYRCELGDRNRELCKEISALISKMKSEPLETITDETKMLLRHGRRKLLNEEDVEIVVQPFIKTYVRRLATLAEKNCTNFDRNLLRI